ncbi:LamG-like jellyroll fold domain-containing protein [Flavobacterium glaciei]|uniref:Secreted protein (Por secretion system target) n=1 Tax=Flavobacterium glaciei TaxID=386300 RepID=A0A562Q7K2_9FLAO|nr:LamG-like jellyroll fold domain-containing protein [Flavobacterium glaciei]RDI58209.1 putative secreted protein (Por secretion system target) [Flavobacterium glaciei]TWI51996.1 putative secreted protein (Por secretion system target) [Flavobacterium glaciei]
MEKITFVHKRIIRLQLLLIILLISAIKANAQTLTTPQVNFTQRTSDATPTQSIYNIKGDFTLLGNTNLTLVNYGVNSDNQGAAMMYVDIDGDSNTWNSSKATLEISNSGENNAVQNCSTVLFAGLYWTGKSEDADTFTASKQVQNGTQTINTNSTVTHNQQITNSNYTLLVTRGNSGSSRWPIYTFSGNGNTYAFEFNNVPAVRVSVNGGVYTTIPSNIVTSGGVTTATLTTPYVIIDDGAILTIKQLTRSSFTNLSLADIQTTSSAEVNLSGTVPAYTTVTKNYDKKVVSLKGPGASTYTSITAKTDGVSSNIYFPGAVNSGIFVGYQEITDYVKTYGPGAYTVADIGLKEGTNSSPGFSGGWVMVVIYQNPLMKSRAVTLFDGNAFVNGPRANGGEFGTIPISGFTTVATGPVNMKLGVMAAEGDVGLTGDYLAVQKLNADPNVYNATNYLTLNHTANTTNNFFNSSIFPFPNAIDSNPNLQNNTGVDFSMFTIPNALNSVIANNQTATTFRFGSTADIFTIFGFAMSVDSYVPEPNGLIGVNSINNIVNPPVLIASPGQTINYTLTITNEGTESTTNTLISIPIPATAIFNVGSTISSSTFNGFSTSNLPYYDSATNKILWDLGTLPVTVGHPEYIYASLNFNLEVTSDCSIILNAGCNPEVTLATGTITGTGTISGSPFTRYFFQGNDNTACNLPIDGSIKVAINGSSCISVMAGIDLSPICGLESVQLAATAGTTGSWSIVSGPSGGGEIFSSATSPTSEFYSPNTGIYTLRWTIAGSGGCTPITDDVQISIGVCLVLNFDGIDDNVNLKDNFNLNSGSFSIETWIKPGLTNGNVQTIFSKRNPSSLTDGYDLRIVNNIISFNWNNGNSITSNYQVSTNRWYHVAVTFDGTAYNLYIDGVSVKNAVAGSNPIANSNAQCIMGAMAPGLSYPYLPTNFFTGWMQELRIWNVALTPAQTHKMMNQRITNNSNSVFGATVPQSIPNLSWSNLEGYYQMAQSTDLLNGFLMDKTANLRNGKLIGIVTAQPETAPLPYTSHANNAWESSATWTHGTIWNIPNTLGVDNSTFIDWNIVKTNHNITTAGNKTVLGLLVESNTLEANNDNKIEISHYLKLDGKIDLVGMSQLVQTEESELDITSSGYIERDQQGQSNLYNYNYWSSPVSPINTIANNTNYTVAGSLKDGTNPLAPVAINWIGGYDGAPTAPISLARYWLYKFDDYANDYANWVQIDENHPIRVGQGFTLKGSGGVLETQNYTFIGKPNNGSITTNSVGDDQLLLTGNPYPSALDADAFITANIGLNPSTDGTLYFWEHYASNNTHILRDYQGGYAVRNLTGGLAPSSSGVDFISQSGTPSRGIPNRYIPVGQGFFVNGKIGSGGTVIFDNSQRGFHKENDALNSNVMFKTTSTKETVWKNNDNDAVVTDTHKKIRLGFNSHNNYHRQVLLGFMDEKATSGMDNGYDGLNIDDFPNDMYFLNGENQLVIQGEGFFDINASYPIGVKTDASGNVKFMIDALENFDDNQPIFLYDDETKIYHNIRNEAFEINLTNGLHNSRFSLRFKDKTLGLNEETTFDKQIRIAHSQSKNIIIINNIAIDTTVQEMTLYNSIGQSITTWKIENQGQYDIQLPIKKISSGVYIVKVKTSKGLINKKIIIK